MGRTLSRIIAVLVTFTFPVLVMAAPAHADEPSTFLASVNGLRASVGAPALVVNSGLASVAQQWADNMASTGVLAHNPDLSTEVPTGWTAIGENIGDGYSLTAVYNALVASPPHYANMVDTAFNDTGIGVTTDGRGQVWVVEDFADYPPPPPATMVFPTTGTVIFPSTQTFSWSEAPGAAYYCLTVGTTQGGVNLVNSGLLAAGQLSYSVPALPGGETLWARIYTYTGGTWIWSDASFSVTGASTATFTQPTNGATGVSPTQALTWSPVASAQYYGITVGTTQGGYNLVNSGPLPSTQASYQPPALPTGQTLWARVYSYIASSWDHYSDVRFTTAG